MDYTLAPLQGLSEANLSKTSIFIGLWKKAFKWVV